MQLKIKIYASKQIFMHLKFILCNYIYLKNIYDFDSNFVVFVNFIEN